MVDESADKEEGGKNPLPRPRMLVAAVTGSLFLVEAVIMNFFHDRAKPQNERDAASGGRLPIRHVIIAPKRLTLFPSFTATCANRNYRAEMEKPKGRRGIYARGGFAFLLVFPVFFLLSCIKPDPPVLKVGINVWPGYEAFYIAEKLGYFAEMNVKLIQFPSASEVIRNYRSGTIDIAALTADESLYLAETGLPLKIALVIDESLGADVLLSKPDIRSLGGLRGKRVAVENTALGAYMITRALEKGGLGPQDIVLVSAEVNRHESLFKNGEVDAAVTFEPVKTKLLRTGARLLFSSKDIPGEVTDVLVVRPLLLDGYPREMAAFLDAYFKALDYLAANPAKASQLAAEREGVSPEEFLVSLGGLHLPDRAENIALLSGNGGALKGKIERLAGVMRGKGLLAKPVDTSGIIEPGPVKGGKP